MDAPQKVRRTVWFRGRVQGVGFRQTTREIAERFAVAGTVENLPDGRVLLVVEASPAEVAAFLAAVASELGRFIAGTESIDEPAAGEPPGFRIRR